MVTAGCRSFSVISEMALKIIQRGLLPADQLITHVFPLEEIGQAFQAAAGGEALKVMVTLSPENPDRQAERVIRS